MNRYEGKVVLITGATGGLGSAIARTLAEEGASIAINYINVGDLETMAKELEKEMTVKFGGKHKAYAADVTKEEEVSSMIENIVKDFGRLDVLVNNAGISINYTSWKYPAEEWQKVIAINLNGAFYCTKHALIPMREQQYGRIISISSVVGITGARGTVAYGATKAALIGMTKTIAREVAQKGITANCLAPGYINAGIMNNVPDKFRDEDVIPSIPMGHLGDTDDIAKAIAFLGSDDAKFITGQVLCVDGGFAM
ncbi:MAG: SDR family oxidoreductase [Fusobacteriaceae bacterium]|nr:SDR family oxidoreductase [Fusobacteriaceae bacterium]